MFILCLREQALGNGNTAAFPPYLFSLPFQKLSHWQIPTEHLSRLETTKTAEQKRLDGIPIQPFLSMEKEALVIKQDSISLIRE